jgi:hypothetical protein
LASGAVRVAELTATIENLQSSAEETSTKLEALSGEKEARLPGPVPPNASASSTVPAISYNRVSVKYATTQFFGSY